MGHHMSWLPPSSLPLRIFNLAGVHILCDFVYFLLDLSPFFSFIFFIFIYLFIFFFFGGGVDSMPSKTPINQLEAPAFK